MRIAFGHYAKWIMGFMFVAMVVTTFSWNGLGRNSNAAATQQNPDDVVATVDGQQITRADFTQQIAKMQQQFGGGSLPLSQMPFLRSYAMQQLEQMDEMLAKAQKMGITASDNEIQDTRDKVLRAEHVRQTLGLTDKATLAEVDQALQQQGHSLDDVLPTEAMKQTVIMQKLQDQIKKSVVVSEQDARNSYTQYHTRHILIDNKKRSDVQAQNLANQVLAKAKAPGADFAALAKQYSEDPGTKNKGGDDGWIDTNTPYVDEFKTAAFSLKPGQITTDLVKSPQFGYFIIKLDAVRSNLPKDFDKNKAKYISQYASTKQEQAWSKFASDLQNEPHSIVMKDPGLKADKEFQDAQRMQPPDPAKQNSLYTQAIADYTKAIKSTTSGQEKAVMYVQIANANAQLKNVAAETAAYNEALKANGVPDTTLLMQLGDLYKQQGQNDNAIDAYQKASKSAWSDMSIHQTLATDFEALGRKDLADAERKTIADYQKTHPQPKTAGLNMTGPGGQPISVKAVTAKPAAHPVKPAQ
jgi:parvulin-like peptidyl-prolyl isomerase